jgi:DNA-binding MarR family transcriptional regulator
VERSEQAVDAFLAASRALVGVSARSLAGAGDVTLPQYRALVIIASRGQVTVSQLADRLDIHPSTATRLCDRLVRKDLIRRAERDADRREIALALAPKGRRLVGQVMRRRRRDLLAIARRMSPEDLERAVVGLRAFSEAAGEMPEATLFGWPEPDEAPSTPPSGGVSSP